MFKIGEFSSLTCVSTKMLRHYDDLGLLKPAHVDAFTGYRYYTAEQLPRLNRLILLKDLGFSLEQIGDILNGNLTPEQIEGMLKLRRAEAHQRLQEEQARLARIESRLWQVQHEHQRPIYDVVVREVPTQWMATIRAVVPHMGKPISSLFDEVEAYTATYRARANTSPLMLFHNTEYRETDLDIEIAVPLTQPTPTPEGNRVTVREVIGGTMACVVYTGDYDKTSEVYGALLMWLGAHEQQYALATVEGEGLREVYIRFGADNADALGLPKAFLVDHPHGFVTEIQIPIRRISQ